MAIEALPKQILARACRNWTPRMPYRVGHNGSHRFQRGGKADTAMQCKTRQEKTGEADSRSRAQSRPGSCSLPEYSSKAMGAQRHSICLTVLLSVYSIHRMADRSSHNSSLSRHPASTQKQSREASVANGW